MKRTVVGLLAVALVAVVCALGRPVAADDIENDVNDYPLRWAVYVLSPIGVGLNYAIAQPLTRFVTNPKYCHLFGRFPRTEAGTNGQPATDAAETTATAK